MPAAASAALTGVIHDRAGFIAWGSEFDRNAERAVIWTSPDGLAWRRVPDVPSFVWADITGVARLGDRLAAVGVDSRAEGQAFLAWTSVDGTTWRPTGGTAAIRVRPGRLAAAGSALVATAEYDTMVRSTDALHWKVVTTQALRGEMSDIVASGDGFIAVGGGPSVSTSPEGLGGEAGPTRASRSTDGLIWRPASLRPAAKGSFGLVAGDGAGSVALGAADGPTFAYRSTDGVTWTKMSTAPDAARDGREGVDCADGPCSYRTTITGLTDGPHGPIAVGRTVLRTGAYRAVVWLMR